MTMNIINQMTKEEALQKIEKVVVEKLQVPADSLFNKSKKRNHIDARQIYFYLCKDRNIRPCYIQDYIFSEHNHKMAHSNILYGQDKIRNEMRVDSDLRDLIKELKCSV